MKRRHCFVATLAASLAAPRMAQAASAAPARSWESTFLRAAEGERKNLMRFIRANWFAMDDVAIAQGLISSYFLFAASAAEPDWDAMVLVGYPQDEGYIGIATAFEVIRAAHNKVTIDGKDLRALGRIVRSVKWLDRTRSQP